MRMGFNSIANYLLFLLAILIFAGFETTFWFQFFPTIPSPMIWLNVMIYLALYRKPVMGIFSIYTLSFALLGFTLIPLKMMWFPLLVIFFLTHLVKSRVFWSGAGYFVIMCFASCLLYHTSFMLISKWLEPNMASVSFLNRLVQILLTPAFAWPVYRILAWFDRMTNTEDLQHSGGLEI